ALCATDRQRRRGGRRVGDRRRGDGDPGASDNRAAVWPRQPRRGAAHRRGGGRRGGLIDRLVVLPDRVLLADFKTNRRPPTTVEATPVAYLRQMASYRAVLRTIFPGRPVRCALIWTREARVAVLPDPLLDPHEPGRAAQP